MNVFGASANQASDISNSTAVYYTYDAVNKLKEIQSDDGMVATYGYDAKGRRISKTVNGITTTQIWDGDYIIREKDSEGTETSRYYRARNLVANNSSDAVNYYSYDPHGSVVSIGGKTYTYDAFGNQTNDIANDTNPFRYNGEYFDNETGYIYLRARYYDPLIGRFTTEDPIKDGLNWYVYCSNNPVMFVDPSGLWSYILYTSGENSNFTEQALWQKEYLEKQGEEVFIVEINTVDNFVNAWNNIEDGTNKVIIYSHGNDRSLILEDGSSSAALTIDGKNSAGNDVGNIGWLEHKDIKELQILSCNSGNLDPFYAGVGNVASTFSWLITGTVIGYDGNVSFGKPFRSFEKTGASSRLSHDQSSFRNITAWYHSGRRYYREPQGKVAYKNQMRIYYYPLAQFNTNVDSVK